MSNIKNPSEVFALVAESVKLGAQRREIDERRREIHKRIAEEIGFDKDGQKTVSEEGFGKFVIKRTPSIGVSKDDLEQIRADYPDFPVSEFFSFTPRLKARAYKAAPTAAREVVDRCLTHREGTLSVELKEVAEK